MCRNLPTVDLYAEVLLRCYCFLLGGALIYRKRFYFILLLCRIMGYAACTGIGFLLSLMGTLVLFGGTNSKNIRTFAVLYVLGNIIGKIYLF